MFYSRPLTDIALRLVEEGLFSLVWSERILAEAHRNLVADGKCSAETARLRHAAIRAQFAEGEVTGFEYLEPALKCDSRDRHVLAATIRGSAQQIVTFNRKHFPAESLEPHEIEAIHPDNFFLNVLDLNPQRVVATIRRQAMDLRRPPLSVLDVIRSFSKSNCPDFAHQLENIERASDSHGE